MAVVGGLDDNSNRITDFLSFSHNIEKNEFIRRIITTPKNNTIDDELKITLCIDNSPQPLSPPRPFIYNPDKYDLNQTRYACLPSKAIGRIFCSHPGFLDKIKVRGKIFRNQVRLDGNGYIITERAWENIPEPKIIRDYHVVERVKVDPGDQVAQSFGFIKDIPQTGAYNLFHNNIYSVGLLEPNENDGDYYFSYTTDILAFVIPDSDIQQTMGITITCEEQEIKYRHTIEAQGYYPNYYKIAYNVISDLNVDSNTLALKDNGERGLFLSYSSHDELVEFGKKITYRLFPFSISKTVEWV